MTVTADEADLVLSAALVAVTVYVPAVLGAVYSPLEEIVPLLADQVTEVFVVPLTVTVNCCVAPFSRDAVVGEMEIETGAFTVTTAEADFVVSAALVAVMV